MKSLLRSAGLLAVALAAGGCGPAANTNTGGTGGATAAADPWPKFAAAVRGNPDPKTARSVVAELTAGLNNAADHPKPADPQALATLAADLRLTDAEKRFVGGSEYTGLDANYLSECLYLLDAAAGLGVTTADPPAVRADAAFRFVVRQVVLSPTVFVPPGRPPQMLPPVPPTFVLARGSGSGLERAFTFIALCRQLDLDAYLIGSPAAADRPWTHPGTAGERQPPNGPFWAVGVRAKEGVLLFDPWRGEAVPGKTAGRPISLTELKADPSACPWVTDKTKPWAVTADMVKEAGLFLSPPLAALSPRMVRLQEKLKDGVGVQVAVDWSAAVRQAEAAADGAAVKGWNPTGDAFTPVRALGSFLPLEQGGLDPTPPAKPESVYHQYEIARLPIDRILRKQVGVSIKAAQDALAQMAATSYAAAFLMPPNPRERIQRGQYKGAMERLVILRDANQKILDGPADDDTLREWYSGLSGVYNRLGQAQGTPDEGPARAAAEKYVTANGPATDRAIGRMIGEAVVGEAEYLLALTAHEQAEAGEAAAARAEREGKGDGRKTAKELWAKAANGWRRYTPHAEGQEASWPGRKAAAEAMAARAEKLK